MLAIGACACLTGATSYVAIGEWAAAQGRAVLDCLGEGVGGRSPGWMRSPFAFFSAAADTLAPRDPAVSAAPTGHG